MMDFKEMLFSECYKKWRLYLDLQDDFTSGQYDALHNMIERLGLYSEYIDYVCSIKEVPAKKVKTPFN